MGERGERESSCDVVMVVIGRNARRLALNSKLTEEDAAVGPVGRSPCAEEEIQLCARFGLLQA
jgi:hypothetical protein